MSDLIQTDIGQMFFKTGSRQQLTTAILHELQLITTQSAHTSPCWATPAQERNTTQLSAPEVEQSIELSPAPPEDQPSTRSSASSSGQPSHASSAQSLNLLVGFINPHVFNLSVEHHSVKQFLNQAALVCIDGIGIKIAIALTRRQWLPRVVAEHLFADFIAQLHFPIDAVLIGGCPGSNDLAAKAMTLLNPHLQIVDTLDGYQSDECSHQFLRKYQHTSLVLIGAGSPRSESLALAAQQICKRCVIFHFGGGTLNTYAGKKKRGPRWISALGCEWIHRMIFEPHTRQRYIQGGWQFFTHVRTHNKTGAPTLDKTT